MPLLAHPVPTENLFLRDGSYAKIGTISPALAKSGPLFLPSEPYLQSRRLLAALRTRRRYFGGGGFIDDNSLSIGAWLTVTQPRCG